MENPFELIMERLDRTEKAISNLKTENSIVAESKPMNLKQPLLAIRMVQNGNR